MTLRINRKRFQSWKRPFHVLQHQVGWIVTTGKAIIHLKLFLFCTTSNIFIRWWSKLSKTHSKVNYWNSLIKWGQTDQPGFSRAWDNNLKYTWTKLPFPRINVTLFCPLSKRTFFKTSSSKKMLPTARSRTLR